MFFQSARSKMPADDYVSIVRSVFKDRVAMLFGMSATAIGAGATAIQSNAPFLFAYAAAFLLLALVRNREALAFEAAGLTSKDLEQVEYWEFRATLSGSIAAIVYGTWSLTTLVFVGDGYATLTAVTITVAAMVGIVARNYGLDRLVTLQSLLVGVPLTLGLMMVGDVYHILLALLFAPMLISFRSVATDIRNVLLTAVHDRVEVSRLAVELDTALATMSHGLCMLDADLKVLVANDQIQMMLCGMSGMNCVGRDFREMIQIAQSKGALTELSGQRLATAVADGGQSKLVLQLHDGRQCEVSINVRNGQTVLVVEDITERVQAENRIKFMARFDPLTNLPNRAYFSEQVTGRLKKYQAREMDTSVAMMIIDIDDFKHINDSFGHPQGDRLLAIISRRIRQTLDSHIVVGRFGGDEFTVFFDKGVEKHLIENAATVLLQTLAKPIMFDGTNIEVRASAGIVISRANRCDLDWLLKRADLALYVSKGEGKSKWSIYHSQMDKDHIERQKLKEAMRKALENGELSLAYQPVIDLRTRKVVGCEALTRWNHPDMGTIPPSIFIPIAEEMGMISELTDWVLHTATLECMGWPDEIGVAVNISARDFRGDNVQKMVASALEKSGLAPERLEIEVTETVLVDELKVASAALSEIAAKGIGIALDDFGTGYSSLGYLHDLPFSKLKIDRTFTADVTSDPRSLKLMRNIARMSRDLEMKVTVEGVETEEQLEVISQLGLIDQIQGYLFGVPVPQSEIASLVYSLSGKPVPQRQVVRQADRQTDPDLAKAGPARG